MVIYGTCLLPLWIIVLSFGGGAVLISYTAADAFEQECDDLVIMRKNTAETDVSSDITINLNIFRDVYTDKWMCSRNCPCEDIETKAIWELLSSEELLETYGRTIDFQFGPLFGEELTFKTYEECIDRADEN